MKFGGDVNVSTRSRRMFDLRRDGNTSLPASRGNPDVGSNAPVVMATFGVPTNDRNYEIMSTVGVNVNADLTDNVGVGVRLLNQRDWGADSTGASAGSRDRISVDLASVTLKEFFYQPLSLVVGRQDLWFGKGFIVGSRLFVHPEIATATPAAGSLGAGIGNFGAK